MKFKTIIILISITLLFFSYYQLSVSTDPSTPVILSRMNQKSISASDSPIIITNNSQLASYASFGTGTSHDPYLIENHNFYLSNSTEKAIEITDTTSYFIIQKNTIFAQNSYGIYLNNVQNGVIENNFINGSLYGLFIEHSLNLEINTNNFNINNFALSINNSNDINVLNNTFFQNNNGLNVIYSFNTTLQSNLFDYNQNAAFLSFSQLTSWNYNKIKNIRPTLHTPISQINPFRNGIQVQSSNHNEFSSNVCMNCSDLLIFRNSNANTITNNTGFNTDSFITFIYSNDSLITGNTASPAFDQGLVFYYSNNNTISGNTIINSINPTSVSTFEGTSYLFLSCSNSTVYNNNATNSITGFNTIESSSSNYTSNVVSNTFQNGFSVINSTNDSFQKNNINGSMIGFSFNNTTSGTIIGNSANKSTINGFSFQNSNKNSLFYNKAYYNQADGFNYVNSSFNNIWTSMAGNNSQNGISLTDCTNNSLMVSILNANQNGLLLSNTNNSLIFDNHIYNNSAYGLFAKNSNFNEIKLSTFSNNSDYAIFLTNSQHNKIFLNSFISNGNHSSQAYSDSSTNDWSNATYGNYWSSYNGSDVNHDKIGDSPYPIDGPAHQFDPHPLMVKPSLNLDNLKPSKSSILDLILGDLLIILGLTVLLACLGAGIYLFISFRKELANVPNKDYHLSFLSFIHQKLTFKRKYKTVNEPLGDETFKKLESIIEENK